jgi:hypothetical protein
MSNTEFTAMGRQEREHEYTKLMEAYKKEICNLHDNEIKLLAEIVKQKETIKNLQIVLFCCVTLFAILGLITTLSN